jgi:hypothetical protein
MADADLTVEILKDIRGEMRGMRAEQVETNRRLGVVEAAILDVRGEQMETNRRLDIVETTLLDLGQQQRFVVRYTKAISERGEAIEARGGALEQRVGKLEGR